VIYLVSMVLMVAEDFEVSIFLTETSTRHSILTKQKHFHEPNKKDIKSNSSKLTGNTNDTAIEVEDVRIIRREDSEENDLHIQVIPATEDALSEAGSLFVSEDEMPARSKRPRATTTTRSDASSTSDAGVPSKRRKDDLGAEELEGTDDKKKLAMNTTYEGFSIYGRMLCLIVKRKDKKGKNPVLVGGRAMMEDWITSTQMPPQED